MLELAEAVGVKMVRSDHLKSYMSEKSLPSFATSFGQKEELVTRIKNIVDESSGKIDIFKELIDKFCLTYMVSMKPEKV